MAVPTREQLIHRLYEAAELEHNLMCTYLYAAFSLRAARQRVCRPPRPRPSRAGAATIVEVAIEEMGHLTAVWNITAALGGSPRFGRGNFPLDPGSLPAGVVVKLAPFNDAVLQHSSTSSGRTARASPTAKDSRYDMHVPARHAARRA